MGKLLPTIVKTCFECPYLHTHEHHFCKLTRNRIVAPWETTARVTDIDVDCPLEEDSDG